MHIFHPLNNRANEIIPLGEYVRQKIKKKRGSRKEKERDTERKGESRIIYSLPASFTLKEPFAKFAHAKSSSLALSHSVDVKNAILFLSLFISTSISHSHPISYTSFPDS